MKTLLILFILNTAQVGNTAPTVQVIETESEAMCQVLSSKMLESANARGVVALTSCTSARAMEDYLK